jgi:hypothetical protein
MRFKDKVFRNCEQKVDGHQFEGCRFEDVTLLYYGTSETVSISGCEFVRSGFEFRGNAAKTLAFLKAMANPASGMQDLVIQAFPELFQIKADFK